jgi:hypothetical protein
MTESATEAFRDLAADLDPDTDYYFVNPHPTYLDALGIVGNESEEFPTIRVLARHESLVWLRDTFSAASRIHTLVDERTVHLRDATLDTRVPVLVGEAALFSLVVVNDVARDFYVGDSDFVAEVRAECDELLANSDTYHLRAPVIPEAMREAQERLGTRFCEGFQACFTVADSFTVPRDFQPVRATIVIAAAEGLLHYDVSKWGESVGVASTASFSRHKMALEDEGVIETDKEPVPMGRPRQRLLLTEEYQTQLEAEGIEEVLQEVARTG